MADEKNTKHNTAIYDDILKKAHEFLEEAEKEYGPKIHYAIDAAKDKIADLEEYTVEEVEKIGEYLKRDLQDAARFSGELKDWLSFETTLIENHLLGAFSVMVDHTREQLNQFEAQARQFGEWRTGEITSFGTLICKSCGEVLHFHKSGHIPPCPKCQGSTWRRPNDAED